MILQLLILSFFLHTTYGLQFVSSSISATLMHTFPYVDYDWPDEAVRTEAIKNEDYVLQNNLIAGLKVYDNTVYVTVPRWRNGVPSSLNSLVSRPDGTTVLRPFPSWEMNKKGDCRAVQYAQSMEIDPNTGYMWIIDTGRVNILSPFTEAENLCPAKIVILDISTKAVMRSYEFPDSVVSRTTNFLNDIVLDYVDGEARFAYITDTYNGKLYVYDFVNSDSYSFEHESMKRKPSISMAPVDGIAISFDFKYVYYCTLSSRELYAIATSVLRDRASDFSENVVFVGRKASGADGMAYGQKSLFYAGLSDNAIYKVMIEGYENIVSLATEEKVMSDKESVQWADTFAFNGTDVWFIANKLTQFQNRLMDFSGATNNMYIWKLEVGEHGYLWNAAVRTRKAMSSVPGIFG